MRPTRAVTTLVLALAVPGCPRAVTPDFGDAAPVVDIIDARDARDVGTDTALCPADTCVIQPDGPCEPPGGPVGNGCCGCGPDGVCSSYCICMAPDTPIATPEGERPIASLHTGDLVLSVDHGILRAVTIARVGHTPVHGHHVVRVELEGGAVVRGSEGHPTADGRTLRDVSPGEMLGNARVLSVETVPYDAEATFDILPASDTGTYLAGGALLGSTMFPRAGCPAP